MKFRLKINNIVASFLIISALVNPSAAWGLTLTAPSAPSAPSAPTAVPTAPSAPEAPTAPFQDNQTTADTSGDSGNTSTTTEPSAPTATNSGNGADSTNDSTVDVTNDTDVTTANNGDVANNVEVDVETGSNDANKNMGDATIVTGDAGVNGSVVNDINNTIVNLDDLCGGCVSGGSATNSGNGSGSNNTASTSTNNTLDINNINNLALVNNENVGASSGSNDANKNMGDGVIVTGDADVVFTTINLGNNILINPEIVNFNVVDNTSEDLIITFPTGSAGGSGTGAANTGNGADSTNSADSTSNSTTTINNVNNLVLDNNVTLYAGTGSNEADKNMGAGNIETGDANIANNIINFLNNNIVSGAEWLLSTVNIYGEMSGDIILPREIDSGACGCASDITAANSGNGSGSTNDSSSTVNDATLISNLNNAVINNNLNLDANTGGNQTADNMGSTSITTGNVDVNSNLVTVANTNTVGQGDTWWLVLVNNQGEWTGKIMGAADGAMIAGSGLEFGMAPDGSIYALNSGNGADSTNSASATSNSNTTINNVNNATINNNVNIVANTGDNQANKNMGGASINTGDVNVASNIVNFINNNFVGKKFVITVVNIFGKFTGNIVPPDQPLPANAGGVVLPQVDLPANLTITGAGQSAVAGVKNTSKTLVNSLNSALEETGKLLENAAITRNNVSEPIKKVINNDQKSSFKFNYLLLGMALLLVAGYTFILSRKASKN